MSAGERTEPRVLNRRTDDEPFLNCCYVGRPSRWGNPYQIGKDGDRSEVIAKFRALIERSPEMRAHARRLLRGKDLVCWCAPLPCHADVLLEVANADDE